MAHVLLVTNAGTEQTVSSVSSMVVLVASWLPARGAARVDPMVALRGE